MDRAVRVFVNDSFQDFSMLLLHIYLWLRQEVCDNEKDQHMWNTYLTSLLNDVRIRGYFKKQFEIFNQLSHYLTLFALMINVMINEKRLLSPAHVLSLWNAFSGNENDNTTFNYLTVDAKIVLLCICLYIRTTQDMKRRFSYDNMQTFYESLKRTPDAQMQNWIEPSNDVINYSIYFFLVFHE